MHKLSFSLLNTRPAHQAQSLTQLIEKCGGSVFNLPLFEIKNLRHSMPKISDGKENGYFFKGSLDPALKHGDCASPSVQPISVDIDNLDEFDYVIFLSANAVVNHFQRVRVIAIGPATKLALEKIGINNIILPAQFNSNGILALPEMQSIQHKKIAILCGENSKTLLPDTLKKRGAMVKSIVCYRRQPIEYDMNIVFNELISRNINCIVSTSLESYHALLKLFHHHRAWLYQQTLCVIHDAMKQQALKDGFTHVIQAENATDEAIVAAIQKEDFTMSPNNEPTPNKQSSAAAFWVSAIAVIVSIGAIVVSVLNFQSSMENKFDTKMQAQQWQLLQKEVARGQKTQNSELLYLVHLANMQLMMGRDPVAALKTLQFAQAQVPATQISIANALNTDIAQLQAVATVDKSVIFSDIAALNQAIQTLSPVPSKPVAAVEKSQSNENTNQMWRERLVNDLKQLKQLFIIRQIKQPVTPLFDAQIEFSIKQNLFLQLSLAQWALLHHNGKIYQSALQAVSQSLTHYFVLTNESKPILDKIAMLQKIQINPVLPSLNNTLMLLGTRTK